MNNRDTLLEYYIHNRPEGSDALILEFYNIMDSCIGGTDQESAQRLQTMVSNISELLDNEGLK